MLNTGTKVELDFVKFINYKKYSDLNSNLRSFIKILFNNIEGEDILQCKRLNTKGKADIIIKLNNSVKYVSIKSGSQNSVHTEKLETFIVFLKKLGVKEEIIKILLLYHFGDGTYDGTGKIRWSAEESKLKYSREIKKFSRYINNHNNFKEIINRILFTGTNIKIVVDAIYYGDVSCGVWCKREELVKYFIKNKCYYISTPHFSSLTYQTWCRNINLNRKSEEHRYYVQIKWFSILSDIIKIRKQNDNIIVSVK